ncbi:hypothetical protein GGTG_01464 [Gaeumannomyces tritici R3-111a-1]|uniref:RNA helicase n=1 Tax=Gaeumannomyces tritici (strain R3-111a-1) TaxID=644352 RepID=J3NJN4_GAET3|nr:hypothetical protein GGTG_01464 [Gaeumannomyces tritici R3-111a-1]EJT81486.1 hypothetical protein GGTG_01464 [Gaeumannomyces tritici R3-111a-1]
MDGHVSKKRKRDRDAGDGSVLKLPGGKTISLDGFLNGVKPKPKPASTENGEAASASKKEAQRPPEPPAGAGLTRPKDPARRRKKDREPDAVSTTTKGDISLLPVRRALPIWEYQEAIRKHMRDNDVLILVGETGSGKSTQVPQFLAEESWCRRRVVPIRLPDGRTEQRAVGGVVAVTQPRRVAATTLAHRVAREAGTPLGTSAAGGPGRQEGLVGYSVRFDHNVPKGTKIKFLTEGMLLQELLHDPSLRQYSAVIVDEVHERGIDVDLLCGFLKQMLLSPDKPGRGGVPLKVVAMSATADIETMEEFFSGVGPDPGTTGLSSTMEPASKTLKIQGRQFPVQTIYSPKPVADLADEVLKTVFKIHCGEPLPGDILVFLHGQEQIEQMQRLIEEYAATLASDVPKIKALPLYGQLSIEAQHTAFRPLKGRVRKVVLATNIAETSVTVPGVRYVVDTGKSKTKQYRPRLGLESLLIGPISQSSAIQRAGRAGREGPGKCYRLYTEDVYKELREADPPEILRNDVQDAVLIMKARGVEDLLLFPLMDTPKMAYMEKALTQLHILSALDDNGAITELGRKMARLPVSASLGRVLLAAASPAYDCLLEAIDIISCISAGDDLFHQLQSEEAREEAEELRRELRRREGDLMTYLTTMQMYTAEGSDRTDWCRARRINMRTMRQALNIRKQLRALCVTERLLPERPAPDPQPFAPLSPEGAEALTKCFMKGFCTRTATLAPDGSYVTTQGKHVVAIHPSSVLHGQKKEGIMFLEHVFTQKNYAKKVAVIQAVWIPEALEGLW